MVSRHEDDFQHLLLQQVGSDSLGIDFMQPVVHHPEFLCANAAASQMEMRDCVMECWVSVGIAVSIACGTTGQGRTSLSQMTCFLSCLTGNSFCSWALVVLRTARQRTSLLVKSCLAKSNAGSQADTRDASAIPRCSKGATRSQQSSTGRLSFN